MNTSWPIIHGTRIIVWSPLPGLDPSLGENALWIGAATYADALAQGKPEAECHILAEAAAYKQQYRVSYAFGNIKIANTKQKKTNP